MVVVVLDCKLFCFITLHLTKDCEANYVGSNRKTYDSSLFYTNPTACSKQIAMDGPTPKGEQGENPQQHIIKHKK
jgi:hypothetical protein